MSDVNGSVRYQPGSAVPEHRHHDQLLIARLVGNDLVIARERAQAESLLKDCPDCAALAADLTTLASATRALSVPARPRDFRISVEQAAKLRGGAIDRLLRRFGTPSLGYVRPLAAATMSIGLVLATIGWLPVGLPMSASAPAPQAGMERTQPPSGVPAFQPDVAPTATQRAAVDNGGSYSGSDSESYSPSPEPTRSDQGTAGQSSGDPLRTLLIFAGLALAVVGLSTLTLVSVGRQRVNDPLLR